MKDRINAIVGALESWAIDLEQGRQVWIPASTLRSAAKALSEQPAQQEQGAKDDADIYEFWARNKEAEQPAQQEPVAEAELNSFGYTSKQPMPNWVSYNKHIDALTIRGRRYSAALFDERGFGSPPGTLFRIVDGPSDVVTMERVTEQPAQPESEAVRAAWMAGYTECEREAIEKALPDRRTVTAAGGPEDYLNTGWNDCLDAIREALALAEQPAGPQGLRPSNAEIIEIRKSVKGSGLELWSDTLAFAHALLNATHGIKEKNHG